MRCELYNDNFQNFKRYPYLTVYPAVWLHLKRAGIPVDRYVAYEIDKYAIKVIQKNYPQIEHRGDVTTADFTEYKGFDLLIGGSPCIFGA